MIHVEIATTTVASQVYKIDLPDAFASCNASPKIFISLSLTEPLYVGKAMRRLNTDVGGRQPADLPECSLLKTNTAK